MYVCKVLNAKEFASDYIFFILSMFSLLLLLLLLLLLTPLFIFPDPLARSSFLVQVYEKFPVYDWAGT